MSDRAILAGGIHSAKQQVVRIDRESGWPLAPEVSEAFAAKLAPALADCDAVLLSDYGSGLITPDLALAIRRAIEKMEAKMLEGHLHHCVMDAMQEGRSDEVFGELVELYRVANK